MKKIFIAFLLFACTNLQAQIKKTSTKKTIPRTVSPGILNQPNVAVDPATKYLSAIGLQDGSNWNAAFVYWCFNYYPGGNPLPKTGSGMEIWNSLSSRLKIPADRALKDPGSIIPGNIFFISESGKEARIGIVVSVNNDQLQTVEADVMITPSRAIFSNKVIRKTRKLSDIDLGFSNFGSAEINASAK